MCTWLLAFVGYFAVMQMMEANVYTKCYGAYCFFISNNSNPTTKLLSDAINECKQYNASLLTILNVDVQNKLEQFVTDCRTSGSIPNNLMDVWLNATKQNPTWTWVNGQVYDATPSGDIMDQGGLLSYNNTYAYLGNGTRDPSKLQLYGYHVFNPRIYWPLYICEIYDATVATCLSQYNGNLLNGRCFKTGELPGNGGTWFDARNACLAHGDLASFNNTDLNTLRNVPWLDSTKTYWIGLKRNKWTVGTIDDSEVKYTNWFQATPSNFGYSCISISLTDWTWTDCDCSGNTYHGVICSNYSATASTIQTPTVSTSSPTSNVVPTTTSSSISPTASTSSSRSENDTKNNGKQPPASADTSLAIPIGVGVGVGGGVLLIIIIIVIVVCLRKRKSNDAEKPTELVENKSDSKKKEKKETKNTGHAIYATVSMKRDSMSPIVENEDPVVTNNSSLEYATLDFVNKQQK